MKKIIAKKSLALEIFKSGRSITEFSKSIGVSRQSLHGILGNHNGASPATAQKICNELNKEFEQLFKIVE